LAVPQICRAKENSNRNRQGMQCLCYDYTEIPRTVWINQKKMNSFSILILDDQVSEIDLPKTYSSFSKFLPENNHSVWEDQRIKIFLATNFKPEVLEAYNLLNAYAYKADLASYCILSKLGGWYSAITNEIICDAPVYDDKDLIIFRDIQKNSRTSWAVACQLIYAKPNNPVFDVAIDIILDNVKNKIYGATPLCVTGPSVFGKAIAQVGDINRYSIGDFLDEENKSFYLEDGTKFANYKKMNSGDVGIKGTNNYNDLWYNKNVYKEKE
jgi:mannosyltransferase OCH1-like enzyme